MITRLPLALPQVEKAKALAAQVDADGERHKGVAADLQAALAEASLLRTRERQLTRDLQEVREARWVWDL